MIMKNKINPGTPSDIYKKQLIYKETVEYEDDFKTKV